jgi:hypothetical protein
MGAPGLTSRPTTGSTYVCQEDHLHIQGQRDKQRRSRCEEPPPPARKEAATNRKKHDLPLTMPLDKYFLIPDTFLYMLAPLFKYSLIPDTLPYIMAIMTVGISKICNDMTTAMTTNLITDRKTFYRLTLPTPRVWRRPPTSATTHVASITGLQNEVRWGSTLVYPMMKVNILVMKRTLTTDRRSSSTLAGPPTRSKRQHHMIVCLMPRPEKRTFAIWTSQIVSLLIIKYLAPVIPLLHTEPKRRTIISEMRRRRMCTFLTKDSLNLPRGRWGSRAAG